MLTKDSRKLSYYIVDTIANIFHSVETNFWRCDDPSHNVNNNFPQLLWKIIVLIEIIEIIVVIEIQLLNYQTKLEKLLRDHKRSFCLITDRLVCKIKKNFY